jgi:hypothetical protein
LDSSESTRVVRNVAAALVAVSLFACDKAKAPEPVAADKPAPTVASAEAREATPVATPARRPAPERVVAIGDLHGDIDAARRVLRLAGAIDDKDAWIGGALVVVQTGDEIDRGDGDRTILDLFERLKGDAKKAGGEVVALVGNHELMNAELDFRYVTPGGFSAFADVNPKDEGMAQALAALPKNQRGRAAAFLPGSSYARVLADRPVIARVGDTIFVHGGVLPKYATDKGIADINASARSWLLGETSSVPKALVAEDGPVWSRMYSTAPGTEECAVLEKALGQLGAKRMVMGHTVQKPAVSPACGEKAWRIDVGMSNFYGGPVQALELRGDTAKILKEH